MLKHSGREHKISGTLGLLAGIAGIACVGLIDLVTGVEVSLSIFYVLPISLGVLFGGGKAGFALSVLAAAVWLIIDLKGGAVYSSPLIPYWNACVRLGFFLTIVFLINRPRVLAARLDSLVKKRTEALEIEVQERQRLEAEAAEISHGEQMRIAHELHDELGAFLAGLSFRAKALAETLSIQNRPEASEAGTIVALANQGVVKVRSFSRLLALTEEDAEDLAGSLIRLGAEVESTFGVTCLVEMEKSLPWLPQETVHELCRIAQEAVRNAVQHAHAQLIEVRVVTTETGLRLAVNNDGKAWRPGADRASGLGLRIMKYRSRRIGAHLSISEGTTGGTQVVCTMPLNEKAPPDIPRNNG